MDATRKRGTHSSMFVFLPAQVHAGEIDDRVDASGTHDFSGVAIVKADLEPRSALCLLRGGG
jgi:hypothetical protein